MATDPNAPYLLGDINMGPPSGFPPTPPWRPSPYSATTQYLREMDHTNTVAALHRRIAVLETQLAQAQAEKMAIEQATHYLLEMAAAGQNAGGSADTNSSKNQEKLEAELRQVKRNNAVLRGKVRKAIQLWSNNVQSQRGNSRHDSPVETLEKTHPPSEGHNTNASAPVPASEGTLIDLLDMNDVTDHVPELGFSETGSSTTPDDVDSMEVYLPSPPKIDIGLHGSNAKTHILNPVPVHPLNASNSSYLRMFTSDSNTSPALTRVGSNDGRVRQVNIDPEYVNPLVNSGLVELTRPDNRSKSQEQEQEQEIIPDDTSFPIKNGVSVDRLNETGYSQQDKLSENPTLSNRKTFTDTFHWIGKSNSLINTTCPPAKSCTTVAECSRMMDDNRDSTGPGYLSDPAVFQYGIRYDPAVHEHNTLRTVSIMGLDPKTTRSELFDNIRGGAVVSMELLNTVSITGTFSALVQFLYERDALAFDDFAAQNPLLFHGTAAYVKVVRTPTWPLLPHVRTTILQLKHTRCLEVHDFPRKIGPTALRQDLRPHSSSTYDKLERANMRVDGVLELGFTSISAAEKGYEVLTTSRKYLKCRVIFVQDPCSLPLDTLKNRPFQVKPVVSMPLASPRDTEVEETLEGTLEKDTTPQVVSMPLGAPKDEEVEETPGEHTTSQNLITPSEANTVTLPASDLDEHMNTAIKKGLLQRGLLCSSWANKNHKSPLIIICQYCKQEGHKASDCEKQQADKERLHCSYCKRDGHIIRFCYEALRSGQSLRSQQQTEMERMRSRFTNAVGLVDDVSGSAAGNILLPLSPPPSTVHKEAETTTLSFPLSPPISIPTLLPTHNVEEYLDLNRIEQEKGKENRAYAGTYFKPI